MRMVLKAEHIVRRYGQRTVVKGVDFHVSQGEIVGLLGPNGAGKTTSFYMVVGLVKPNSLTADNSASSKSNSLKCSIVGRLISSVTIVPFCLAADNPP